MRGKGKNDFGSFAIEGHLLCFLKYVIFIGSVVTAIYKYLHLHCEFNSGFVCHVDQTTSWSAGLWLLYLQRVSHKS